MQSEAAEFVPDVFTKAMHEHTTGAHEDRYEYQYLAAAHRY